MERTRVNWRKSSFSGNNGTDCVEVGTAPWRTSPRTGVVVRDTTDRAAATVAFPAAAWRAFAARVIRNGLRT
jgi:hypothetical protein